MKSAILLSLLLSTASARADWCSICDSIRSGSQTIPAYVPPRGSPEEDDSMTEAGLPAYLRPREQKRYRIDLAQIRQPLEPYVGRPRPMQVLSLDQQAAQLVNQYRRQSGLADLVMDDQLNALARSYARELHDRYVQNREEISHGNFQQRMSGLRRGAMGENIARGQFSAQDVVHDWMRSPHRQNIMGETMESRQFRRQGMAEYNGFWVNIFSD